MSKTGRMIAAALLLAAAVLCAAPADAGAAVQIRQTLAGYTWVRTEITGRAAPGEALQLAVSTSPYGIYADWSVKTRKLTDTEYEISGLAEGSTYYLRAYEGSRAGRPYAVVTSPAGSISGCMQTAAGKKTVSVSWNGVPGADSYLVWAEDAAGKSYGQHYTTKLSGRISVPRQGETYRAVIVPVRKRAGFAAEGKVFRSGMTFSPLPVKISGVTFKKNRLDTGSAYFIWKKDGGADGYEIRITGAANGKQIVSESEKASAWVRDKGLSPGAFFKIKVRGYVTLAESRACGPWSDTVCFCGDPESVKLDPSAAGLSAQWKKVRGADSYRLYVSDKRPVRLSDMKKVKTVKKPSFRLQKFKGKKPAAGKSWYLCIAAVKHYGGKVFAARPSRYYYIG